MNSKLDQIGTAELLVRFYDKNDEAALSEFFLRFKDLAFRIAYNVLGNTADAEDITQQTFVQILKKQAICNAAYQGEDYKVKSWLLAIIYNASRMQYNSNKKTKTYELKEGAEVESPSQTDSETNSDNNNILSKVHSAIFDLPEKYRVPIMMRYHQDMSIDDISKTLASQPGTIRSILSRGVSLLRNKLSSEKNMLSSTAAIELIAAIPYPMPHSNITLSLIKSINASNPHVFKAVKASQAKLSLFLKSAIAFSFCASVITGLLFFNNKDNRSSIVIKNDSQRLIPQKEKSLTVKDHWDFSSEKGDDILAIQNKTKYNDDLKSLTNAFIDEKNPSAAVVKLPFKIITPTKIIVTAKVLTERGMYLGNGNYHNSLEYVPILANNTPSPGAPLFLGPLMLNPNSKNKNNEIQFNHIFYIFENVCVSMTEQGKIIKIHRFDNLKETPFVGIIIANFAIDKIDIKPIDEVELKTITETALTLLNEEKAKKEKQ